MWDCTTPVAHHTTPPPIFLLKGPGSFQILRHPMLHLPVMCRANCETLKKIVTFAMLSAVRGRNFFERLFFWSFSPRICVFCSPASRRYRESRRCQRRLQATDISSSTWCKALWYPILPSRVCVGCSRRSRFSRFSFNILERPKLEKKLEASRSILLNADSIKLNQVQ